MKCVTEVRTEHWWLNIEDIKTDECGCIKSFTITSSFPMLGMKFTYWVEEKKGERR